MIKLFENIEYLQKTATHKIATITIEFPLDTYVSRQSLLAPIYSSTLSTSEFLRSIDPKENEIIFDATIDDVSKNTPRQTLSVTEEGMIRVDKY